MHQAFLVCISRAFLEEHTIWVDEGQDIKVIVVQDRCHDSVFAVAVDQLIRDVFDSLFSMLDQMLAWQPSRSHFSSNTRADSMAVSHLADS